MRTRKFLLATVFLTAIISSGCTSELPISNSGSNQEQPSQISGKGLEVTSFRVTDQTLAPSQNAEVTLALENYHQREIEMGNIQLQLTEPLSSEKLGCNPDEIEPARQGVTGKMECNWRITAPSEDEIGAFSQRKTSFSAYIPYNSTMENYQPLTLSFKPYRQINTTNSKAISFSNGEIEAQVQTESPVALEQDKNVNFRVSKAGSGGLSGNFSFEYGPDAVFDGRCPEEKKPVLQNAVEFNCPINLDTSQASERNLFFTVHYKYVQTPSMDVTIVRN